MKEQVVCPHCTNDDKRLIEPVMWGSKIVGWLCNNCGKTFKFNGD